MAFGEKKATLVLHELPAFFFLSLLLVCLETAATNPVSEQIIQHD